MTDLMETSYDSVVQQIHSQVAKGLIPFFINPDADNKVDVLEQVIAEFSSATFFELDIYQVLASSNKFRYNFIRLTQENCKYANFYGGVFVMVYNERNELNMFGGLDNGTIELKTDIDPRDQDQNKERKTIKYKLAYNESSMKILNTLYKQMDNEVIFFSIVDNPGIQVMKDIFSEIIKEFEGDVNIFDMNQSRNGPSFRKCYEFNIQHPNWWSSFAMEFKDKEQSKLIMKKDAEFDITKFPESTVKFENIYYSIKRYYDMICERRMKKKFPQSNMPIKETVKPKIYQPKSTDVIVLYNHSPETAGKVAFLKANCPQQFKDLQISRSGAWKKAEELDKQLIDMKYDEYVASKKAEDERIAREEMEKAQQSLTQNSELEKQNAAAFQMFQQFMLGQTSQPDKAPSFQQMMTIMQQMQQGNGQTFQSNGTEPPQKEVKK